MNTINVTSAPKTATFQMRINPEVKQRMEDIYARQDYIRILFGEVTPQ